MSHHACALAVCVVACVLLAPMEGYGQFSPGELSAPHAKLEGMNNCLQCHEQGKEISGTKCLTCHQEIRNVLDKKHGYHYRVASQRCVTCHKEHLGRNARTVIFDRNTFDHSLTGFERTGRHAAISCNDCHTKKKIQDPFVRKLMDEGRKDSYLGLEKACVSCHDDIHNATVGRECQNCHGTVAWTPAASFNHAKSRFPLQGSHASIDCRKCHEGYALRSKGEPLLFSTKSFVDCAPCHTSPHSVNFSRQQCSACHSPAGWRNVKSAQFNHDLTNFPLVGRHVSVACSQCHKPATKPSNTKSMRLAHGRCMDCHSDYHKGQFAARLNGECGQCHTPYGFSPSSYTLSMHNTSRFILTGAHAAVSCARCHRREGDGASVFRFANLRCESCHKDKHGGQFSSEMREKSCAACHATDDWFPRSFDHSRTSFALAGKHAQISCDKCHKAKDVGGINVAQFKGTQKECQSCHKEIHGGQFAVNGMTECATCHQPSGWKLLVFDHNTQSQFTLTGAHRRTACKQCHREERSGGTSFVRYKPLSQQCESCHARRSMGDG